MLQLSGVYFFIFVLKIHDKEGNNVAALLPQVSKLPNLQVSGSVFIFKAQKGNSFCALSLHSSPSVLSRDVTRRRCQDRMVSAPALLNYLNVGMLAPPSK